MPPFLIPPLVKWTLVAVGGAMLVHWAVREVHRINEEIEQSKRRVKVSDGRRLPTLRRDPVTGEYRP